MSVIDFFEYLAANDATRSLALALADAWTEYELGDDALVSAA
jgi:hypothetical protein